MSAVRVGARQPALLALVLLSACVTSARGGGALSSIPDPEVKQLDAGRARGGADTTLARTRWCDDEAPPVVTNAPPDIVSGIHALAAMSASELKQHVRGDVQARVSRAMYLHGADAISVNEVPLDPMTVGGAENDVAALLAEGKACNAALVAGEMRIDFPPPFEETRDENAREIDAVHDVLYAGTSVTAYCGPCAIYALVVAPRASGGIDVIAWDSLVGSDPMRH